MKEDFILVIGKIMEKVMDKNKVKDYNINLVNINIKDVLKMEKDKDMVK
jgi:hypothetical protein